MEKFQLTLLFKIIGIGSASGLVYTNEKLFVISDNSSFLYEYHIPSQKLEKIALSENPQDNIPKKDKPDFEAIAHFENSLYLFGSGSTAKRNTMLTVDTGSYQVKTATNLEDIYLGMQSFGEIKPEDFNIEGADFDGENWYLFNRGNGQSNKNTVFSVQGKNLNGQIRILSNDYALPKIKGVNSSFTDAVLVGNKLYFLATAEDTQSTYLDGEVLGSFIGRIDLNSMEIDFTLQVSDTHKFEGLTLYKQSAKEIEFLLCEDNDTDLLESGIYSLRLPIK